MATRSGGAGRPMPKPIHKCENPECNVLSPSSLYCKACRKRLPKSMKAALREGVRNWHKGKVWRQCLVENLNEANRLLMEEADD